MKLKRRDYNQLSTMIMQLFKKQNQLTKTNSFIMNSLINFHKISIIKAEKLEKIYKSFIKF